MSLFKHVLLKTGYLFTVFLSAISFANAADKVENWNNLPYSSADSTSITVNAPSTPTLKKTTTDKKTLVLTPTPDIAKNKILHIDYNNENGLGNRIKKTISYLRYYKPKHLNMYWPAEGWVSARFQDLFNVDWNVSITEYNAPHILNFKHPQPLYPYIEDFSLLVARSDFKTTPPKQINHLYNQTPQELIDIYLPYFQAIHPSTQVQARINEVKLPPNAVAVQIRNAPDWQEWFHGNEPSSAFFEVMDTYPEDTIFYLSAMSKEEALPFYARYPHRIVELPNKDYKSMVDAVADMFIIGTTENAIYSISSTFAEVAWWLGGAKANVQLVGTYNHWILKKETAKLLILNNIP